MRRTETVYGEAVPSILAEAIRKVVDGAPAGGVLTHAVTRPPSVAIDAVSHEQVEASFPIFLSPGQEFEVTVRRR